MLQHVDVSNEGLSRRRDHSSGEHARSRRLACSIGTEKPENFALGDREVQGVDGLHPTGIDLGEIHGSDDGL